VQIIKDKVLLVNTSNPNAITSAIRKSSVVEQKGSTYDVAVHWGLDEARALTALKIKNVPSPIVRDYKWSGKLAPFEHQKTTSSFFTLHDKAFCFSEQGTGKTASVIWAVDFLIKRGDIKRVLVLCPVSIMQAAWQQDIFRFAMHRSCVIAHGDSKARIKAIKSGAEIVIINYDGLGIVADEIKKAKFDLVVVDEANAYKNPRTQRWKVLNDVMKGVKRLWMMTGTPAAQSPMDAFGLAKLVNPDTPQYLGAFRDMVMFKATQFTWVARPGAKDIVHNYLQPAIRFEKSQCLDLPPVTFVERDAPLTTMQLSYYNTLKKTLRIEAAGETVTAVNAGVKINKMLQISGGAVYTDTGEVLEFDVSNRLKAVLEVINESSHKVLVFVPFTHTIALLKAELERNNITCDVINGNVPISRRGDIIKQFQTSSVPQVLILQPQTAAHGLTLTAANTVIWYAPVTSVETYLQANARIDRPGQHNPMTIVHIKGSPVEDKVYTMLRRGLQQQSELVALYKEVFE